MSDEWLCVQVSAAIELGTKQGSGTSPWGTYAYLTNIYCRNVPRGCGVRLKVNVCTMGKSNSPTTPLGCFVLLFPVVMCCSAGYAYLRVAPLAVMRLCLLCVLLGCTSSRDGPRESAAMSLTSIVQEVLSTTVLYCDEPCSPLCQPTCAAALCRQRLERWHGGRHPQPERRLRPLRLWLRRRRVHTHGNHAPAIRRETVMLSRLRFSTRVQFSTRRTFVSLTEQHGQ